MDESPLYQAVRDGNINAVRNLLDSGADVHYLRPHGYDVLIDAMHGADASQLLSILQLLIDRGAPLSGVSDYAESALNVASLMGRFDAIRLLLKAGANPELLQWTPLMHAIALGPLEEIDRLLLAGSDLSARDFWSRTPWLLSLATGDVSKAKRLLAAGANRKDKGRCDKPPLMYPAEMGNVGMLRWLLSEGFDPNETDEFGGTPLLEAVERGNAECVTVLLDAGADIHHMCHGEAAIKRAATVDIARLLVDRGADLEDVSNGVRRELTRLPASSIIEASAQDYAMAKHRTFGESNPQKMNYPFWISMIRSGKSAHVARQHFGDTDCLFPAVWCFQRFGKSLTELPDGRTIEIAGEHEDFYDPDFCIYNDVVVHQGDGRIDIYGYPKECFPPTDFHSATLVGQDIYVIGSIGYRGERKCDETPVYRLSVDSFAIERIKTSGDLPGWIHGHKARLHGDKIHISGGEICVEQDGVEKFQTNENLYVLDVSTMNWQRLS